jgi:hypothetical protein
MLLDVMIDFEMLHNFHFFSKFHHEGLGNALKKQVEVMPVCNMYFQSAICVNAFVLCVVVHVLSPARPAQTSAIDTSILQALAINDVGLLVTSGIAFIVRGDMIY